MFTPRTYSTVSMQTSTTVDVRALHICVRKPVEGHLE